MTHIIPWCRRASLVAVLAALIPGLVASVIGRWPDGGTAEAGLRTVPVCALHDDARHDDGQPEREPPRDAHCLLCLLAPATAMPPPQPAGFAGPAARRVSVGLPIAVAFARPRPVGAHRIRAPPVPA